MGESGGEGEGGSKEEQNIKAERERAQERDKGEGVFMLVRKQCESEIMEQQK